MGQVQGNCKLQEGAVVEPFVNLPAASIRQLKADFDVTATSWGLSDREFNKICSSVGDDLQKNDAEMAEASQALFNVLDSDSNGSVDALEFLATIALLSGMEDEEKIAFVYNLYDFAEVDTISKDECTLSMRSTLVGLDKISGCGVPADYSIEVVSSKIFASAGQEEGGSISSSNFLTYCGRSPNVSSYISYFTALQCVRTCSVARGCVCIVHFELHFVA